jgi:hypothetical protein
MPARTGYEHHPDFWHGRLAYAVGIHLRDEAPEGFLRDTYEQYLDSPAVSAETRRQLPRCPRVKRKRVRA